MLWRITPGLKRRPGGPRLDLGDEGLAVHVSGVVPQRGLPSAPRQGTAQGDVLVQAAYRGGRGRRVLEGHEQPAAVPLDQLSEDGFAVLTTGTPDAMYSSTWVGRECR